MIQRLQSIFLAIVNMSIVAILAGDIWIKTSPTDGKVVCTMSVWYLEIMQNSTFYFPYCLVGILASTIATLSMYIIVKHENRKLQIKLTLSNLLMLIVLIVLVMYFIIKNDSIILPNAVAQYQWRCILFGVALISNFIAYYCIKRDEALVNHDSLR